MALSIRQTSVRPMRAARPARAVQPVKAMLSPAVAIGGATCAMLVLGRFVFLPFQRRELDYQQEIAGPKTTGSSYFDKLQQQSTFTLQSKDPSKFGFIDVLGWGALGHVLGFAALAASSLADSVQKVLKRVALHALYQLFPATAIGSINLAPSCLCQACKQQRKTLN
ncbi:hypothetical protein QJQ45_013401 [Haematococcus lacustris]|nr:hypothetical protein QJQ45_013401 [Haematococcus lacustris]